MTINASTGFFITGTDTEVGKTLVAGALILKLGEAGISAVGFKPVVAGTYVDAGGKKFNGDLETLRIASGLNSQEQSLCPYVLDQAAAPHLAAKENDVYLDSTIILGDLHSLNQKFEAVVVEGRVDF